MNSYVCTSQDGVINTMDDSQNETTGFFCVKAAIMIQINNKDAPEINPVSFSLLPYWKVTCQWTPADPHPAVIIIRGLTWILSLFWFDVGFIFAYNKVSRYLTVTRDALLIVTYRRSNTSSTTSRPKITSTTLSLSLWACGFCLSSWCLQDILRLRLHRLSGCL